MRTVSILESCLTFNPSCLISLWIIWQDQWAIPYVTLMLQVSCNTDCFIPFFILVLKQWYIKRFTLCISAPTSWWRGNRRSCDQQQCQLVVKAGNNYCIQLWLVVVFNLINLINFNFPLLLSLSDCHIPKNRLFVLRIWPIPWGV